MKKIPATLALCAIAAIAATHAQTIEIKPFASDPEAANLFYDYVISGLDGRTWLVTPDGALDADLTARAKKRGVDLVTIPMRGATPETVAKFHAAVKTLKNPRLTAAAHTRPAQFVMSWLIEDPDGAAAKLALLNNATMPAVAGLAANPSGLVYTICPTNKITAASLKSSYAKFLAIHEEAGELFSFRPPPAEGAAVSDAERMLRRTISMQGNNIGFMFHGAGLKDEAARAFTLAHSIDPDNISPLLNLATVMREGAKTGAGTAAKISAQLTAWGKAGVNSWTLSDTSGFVLKPEDFIPAKWYWASSGIPLGGADRFNEYLDKIEDPAVIDALRPRTPVKVEMIAEAFRQQLAAVPDPAGDYYLNCAQVFLLENETARAQAAVAAAEAAGGANPEQLARLKAGILTASGNKNDAVAALESAKTSENAAKILETLAATHFISGDTDGFQRAVAELAALPDAPPWAADLLAASKAAAENPAAALVAAERMMDVNPKPLFAVSLALNIAWTSRDLAKADKFAREMLNINPRDFLANYVRAGCFMAEKKTAEAERHYAAAVTVNPVWFALNDFAALLTDLGKYEPALKLAEQALKTGGGEIAAVWDTYATVLRKTGKTDEAWDAYKTAVEKTGGEDPRIHLNVAEMALERKDTATAKKSLAVIDADKDSLSIDERERLGKIRAKLR